MKNRQRNRYDPSHHSIITINGISVWKDRQFGWYAGNHEINTYQFPSMKKAIKIAALGDKHLFWTEVFK